MRVARAIVALVVIGTSATARPAAGQEPGVVIDPASPAGKEYAFPLDVQRAAAVGKDAVQGVPQPLFGVGITRAAGGGGAAPGRPGAAAGGSRRSGASGSKPGSTSRRSSRRSAGGAASGRRRAAKGSRNGPALAALSRPGSTSSEVALVTLAVVFGGLAVGGAIALARRRRT